MILESSLNTWLPSLLQTTDSLFPTGAYAHSGGLETLVELNVVRDAQSLTAFLTGHVIPALERFELPYLGFSVAAARDDDAALLAALDHEYGAGKLPREARDASAQVGIQRLDTLMRILRNGEGRGVAERYRAHVERGEADGHAAIVCGVQAHWLGIPVFGASTAYFYASIAGFCGAALKLIRIGQDGCQRVLAHCLTLADATVGHAAAIPRPEAGWCDPLWEIAAARHERAFARLFIS